MSKYLAKSNPIETLEEHTLELLKNYEKLKSMYPEIEVDWDVLKYACIYHDMGKINPKFQAKLNGKKLEGQEIHHGHLSIAFLDYKSILNDNIPNYIQDKNISDYVHFRKKMLANTIFFHHDRKLITRYTDELEEIIKSEIQIIKEEQLDFTNEIFKNIEIKKMPSKKIFDFEHIECGKDDDIEQRNKYIEYAKVKGLLNKIDYCASAHEEIEYKNDFLINTLDKKINNFKQTNKNANWNALQVYMKENKESNIVAIAQTGMGKTEAGLLWLADSKGFFTLPLKTAINSIYTRVISDVEGDISKKVALLHSDIYSKYLNLHEDKEFDFELEDYVVRSKQYSMPLTICTIDQIFDFVYKYLGSEIKMAVLSYSKVIVDEIQMYDPKLLAVIVMALKYIDELGGKFAILTATMPPFLIDELRNKKIKFEYPKPFVDDSIRHSVKIENTQINSEYIKKLYCKNKVLVICNTVKKAQELYKEISNYISDVYLFHSSYIKEDRDAIEKNIINFTNDKQAQGIWICTQVVEASLDIDFDILITELSDINGLFQRFGRCYRKREYTDKDYNCYVFVGEDEKYTSGIGTVIDKKIFELSKNEIKKINGKISEKEKLNIIEKIYTTDNLKNTEFYKKYSLEYDYLESLSTAEKGKNDTKKEFRNIKSIYVIPTCVYQQNKDELEKNINLIRMKNKNVEDIKQLKRDKILARQYIQNLTVSVRYNLLKNLDYTKLEITKYISLVILDIDYDKKIGIVVSKEKNTTTENDILERMV